MKIYFALDEDKCFNPYVSILIKRLKEIDSSLEIHSGISVFWSDEIFSYNIIHIHWPDLLLKNTGKTVDDLQKRIDKIKHQGVKIITTCHNIEPHFAKFEWQTQAYAIVYDSSDLTLHMGSYSFDIFKNKYPNSKQAILLHHIYDDRYKNIPSRAEAAKKLGLKTNAKYILCLGAFRNQQERNLLLGLSSFLKKNSIKILAPSFFVVKKPTGIRSMLRYIKAKLKCLILDIRNNIKTCAQIIPEDEIPLYGAIADIMLLQRTTILNSGNIPMAFYLEKVMVGPDTGNVGELLKKTGNPVFDIDNLSTLESCIQQALRLAKDGYGKKNKEYALQFLSSPKIARQLLDYYKQI